MRIVTAWIVLCVGVASAAGLDAARTRTSPKGDYGVAAPIFRFDNTRGGGQFFTTADAERTLVRATLPAFVDRGVAFYAYPEGADGTQPVYRFYNGTTGTHFFTLSEDERAQVVASLPHIIFEGVGWHAFAQAQATTAPVHRFFARHGGFHLYSIDPVETAAFAARGADYVDEGVAFHAYPSRPASLPANQAPTVVLAVSSANAFVAPAAITLSASANDADGTVLAVEFFNGSVLLGEVRTPPYRFEWAGVDAGTYALSAKATDNLGSTVTSLPIAITVVSPGPAVAADTIDAARLLTQATFGIADPDDIDAVKTLGAAGWIDREFSRASGSHLDYLRAIELETAKVEEQHAYEAIWQQMLDADDQLRTRVAFALSEIVVISNVAPDQNTWALASWMDMLKRNAFGNYRQLLEDATLHPAMGYYLNMLGNAKEDPARNRRPNENYAREILQLFSIGLVELNPDGSPQLGADGKPVATYDQSVVEGFAKVFTGWNFAGNDVNDAQKFFDAKENWIDPMAAWPAQHSTGTKKLLRGTLLPAAQTPQKDLRDALDNIFAHPNIGPFVARRLIQFLVTSNPSAAYIGRVTAAFNDNGSGVRGDMKAVIRAILLDPQARDVAVASDARFGKLREPVLRFTALMRVVRARAVNGRNSVWWLDNPDDHLGQSPLIAPSVFNFFSPNYVRPGALAQAGLVAPEFQITTETQVVGSSNFFHWIVGDGGFGFDNPGRRVMDFQPLVALAGDPARLVDRLNLLLCTGQMSAATRSTLIEAVQSIDASERLERAKTALFLTLVAPDFVVQR